MKTNNEYERKRVDFDVACSTLALAHVSQSRTHKGSTYMDSTSRVENIVDKYANNDITLEAAKNMLVDVGLSGDEISDLLYGHKTEIKLIPSKFRKAAKKVSDQWIAGSSPGHLPAYTVTSADNTTAVEYIRGFDRCIVSRPIDASIGCNEIPYRRGLCKGHYTQLSYKVRVLKITSWDALEEKHLVLPGKQRTQINSLVPLDDYLIDMEIES